MRFLVFDFGGSGGVQVIKGHVPGKDAWHFDVGEVTSPTPLRASYAMSGTHIAHGAIGLRASYAMSGTQISVRRCAVLRSRTALLGPCGGGRVDSLFRVRWYALSLRARSIGLRSCYAKSGTDVRFAAIGLRTCYAKSGTAIACGAIGLRACYAKSGTETAYGPDDARSVDREEGATPEFMPGAAKSNANTHNPRAVCTRLAGCSL
eukprot:2951497-Rhodomonas_salina.3